MHPVHSVPSVHPMPLLSNLVPFGCARPALLWASQGGGGQEATKFPLRCFGCFGPLLIMAPTKRRQITWGFTNFLWKPSTYGKRSTSRDGQRLTNVCLTRAAKRRATVRKSRKARLVLQLYKNAEHTSDNDANTLAQAHKSNATGKRTQNPFTYSFRNLMPGFASETKHMCIMIF